MELVGEPRGKICNENSRETLCLRELVWEYNE
jgi:hypothetical protein